MAVHVRMSPCSLYMYSCTYIIHTCTCTCIYMYMYMKARCTVYLLYIIHVHAHKLASLDLSPFSEIGQCCVNNSISGTVNCVTLGGGEAQLTVFPREAMASMKPYPFGLDPVSIRLYAHVHVPHSATFSCSCSRFGVLLTTSLSSLTPTR